MMPATWSLPFLFFHLLNFSPQATSAFLGFGNAGGGFGVWIDRRGATTTTPRSAPSSEYTALQAWKSAITDDPSGILDTWAGPDVCSYSGVFCSDPPEDAPFFPSSPPVVSAIDLNRASLEGTLVRELSLLFHLSLLHLNSNRFAGAVPDSFRDLRSLTELDLSNNIFSGAFPTPTLLIPNLVYLDLRFNNFSGELPGELFVKDLDAIFLNNNRFEGEIPMSLWGSPASVITLANNQFTGNIPASFGYAGGGRGGGSGIREVLFLNNRLTGCIPEGIGFSTQVEVLDLSFNGLSGHLPGSLGCLAGIEVLDVAHNRLSGVLPDPVCSLESLANLTVSYNFFSGFGRECGGRLFEGEWFDFVGNCIPGWGKQRPPPECAAVPGGGLSCLRIPTGRPMGCGGHMGGGVGAGSGGEDPDYHAFPRSMPSLP